MAIILFPILIGILLVGIGGIFVTSFNKRLVLWLLSIPLLCFGFIVLSEGGIVERFSPNAMFFFCSIMFWPTIGCVIGEIRKMWREPKKPDKSKKD